MIVLSNLTRPELIFFSGGVGSDAFMLSAAPDSITEGA